MSGPRDDEDGIEDDGATVAVVGSGMIGRSWSIAFARGGYRVRLHDVDGAALDAARDDIHGQLDVLAANGLSNGASPEAILERVSMTTSLPDALDSVVHVQENAPERVELKRDLFGSLDALAPPGATLASSSSALLPSALLDGVKGVARCLVAHPLNPPHLVPAVELVPHPDTSSDTMRRAAKLFEGIGQRPITLTREIEGFVMNRLQGALLEEAFRLIDAELVSVADLDAALKDGLGLRWSFMGPIETIDLNAPGGVTDFIARYGEAYRSIAASAGQRASWEGTLAERLRRERRAELPEEALTARRAWRDRRLVALAVHKRDAAGAAADEPHPSSGTHP